MPTNLIKNTGHFTGINSVLASEIGLRAARMLTIDLTQLTPLSGQDLILKPGTVIYQMTSGLGRAYPASKAIATTATSSKIIKVDNPTLYKVGDVLKNQADAALGTIASIDGATGDITLAANSATAIAVGDAVAGDPTALGTPYGIIISEIDITALSNDVACYTSASVFRERMPYWSAALSTAFPEITMVNPIP
jgi:hypothetical protein